MRQIIQSIINYFKRRVANQNPYRDYSYLYNTDNTFTEEFFLNLIKTINWTESIISQIGDKRQINFGAVLRATNPCYEGRPFYRYEDTWFRCAATPAISFNYKTVLEDALKKRQVEVLLLGNAHLLGQVLEFDIDLTTHDGAPCAESGGFVDESDILPIDTWFYLTKTHLYCWIPNLFIEQMQRAIDVEIFDSYRWVKDSNPSLQNQIVDRLRTTYNEHSPDNKSFER